MLLEDVRPNDRSAEVLYHREKGYPDNVVLPKGFSPVIQLRYGSHARMEAMQDRYGDIQLPKSIDVRTGDIFEIGVTGRTVTKMGVRFSYDDKLDYILIISTQDGFVRTVWANEKADTHKTLNLSKYADPKRHN